MSKLADKIKQAGLRREPVDLPYDLGESVYVRELTGAERGELEASMSDPKKADIGKLRIKLVAMTLVDESGSPVFADAKEVGELSGALVGKLSDTALEISGFTESALDDAVKN